MEQHESNVTMEKLVSLCKRRGFIYSGSEIYGGLAGTFDYGPLGVTLKKNIENIWWQMFVDDREDMYGIDAAILMNPKAWVASGHVGGFDDPMIQCNDCKVKYRTDNLIDACDYFKYREQGKNDIEEFKDKNKKKKEELEVLYKEIYSESGLGPSIILTKTNPDGIDAKYFKLKEEIDNIDFFLENIKEHERLADKFLGEKPKLYLHSKEIKCLSCKKINWSDSFRFNMMFSTNVGPVQSDDSVTYLRPETAGGMFVNFKNVVDSFHPKLPFGLGQIGKAFRNEIAPRDFIFRVRELEQMEIEYFVHPNTWEEHFEHWRVSVHAYAARIGLDATKVHELEVAAEDRAHYSSRTIDFEFDYPFGRKELYGLAYRGDFDLSAHQEGSKAKLEYFDEESKEKLLPHVIEPSFGVGRTLLAVLCSAYREDATDPTDIRAYLAFEPRVAPIKLAVFPLLKNKEVLTTAARELQQRLKKEFGAVVYDDAGSIGKRYRKQDEIGTPYCVTADFESVEGETKGTYTIRDRDTGAQERMSEEELCEKIRNVLR
jgi:glycyl-tRNA synthetase